MAPVKCPCSALTVEKVTGNRVETEVVYEDVGCFFFPPRLLRLPGEPEACYFCKWVVASELRNQAVISS